MVEADTPCSLILPNRLILTELGSLDFYFHSLRFVFQIFHSMFPKDQNVSLTLHSSKLSLCNEYNTCQTST